MTLPIWKSQTKLISDVIEQLRSCCQVNIQSTWLYQESHLNITEINVSNCSAWPVAQLNAKEHIAWTGGKKVLWLVQKVVVPLDLQGYRLAGLSLRLALGWWADAAEIYVNGELVLEGDLFDCWPRVLLSPRVTPGEEFIVALRLVSPGHDNGALVRSLLVYESDDGVTPGFVADELAVVQLCVERLAPEKLAELAEVVGEVINRPSPIGDATRMGSQSPTAGNLPTALIHQDAQEELIKILRERLIESDFLAACGWGKEKGKIYLVGHAHLDLAWLWPVSETWRAAQNTFESVLKLQADFSELIFCHSTPALYAWVEEHRPDLFRAIQDAVAAGCWEVVGGLWVEPELNLISGESIVRQLLYGQRYVLEKFGKLSTVAWLPDTFGFCATLPQFLVNAGMEFFVTQKLRWNDTTKFDHGAFWWRSPDGSEIFSVMSALIGESIDPVKMASYLCEWQTQTDLEDALWLPGVGDHGGGPTRDMLETAQRWQKSPIFPALEFTTSEKYLQQIKTHSPLPTWNDELYLEFHRGCYTTHADQKQWNRRCEDLLYQAELFATLATVCCGVSYPQAEIETAWKQVLFNQFHDILPGSSITQVYQDALPEWQQVEQVGTKILQQSLQAIASQAILPPPPHPEAQAIFVFNALNWQRSEVVEIVFPDVELGQIYDIEGNEVLFQSCFNGEIPNISVSFLANDIPACGYRVFWLCPGKPSLSAAQLPDNYVLENEYLRVTVDELTGDLASVFDKIQQCEVLNGRGNQLQAFQDSGQYWDAWNIDPNYAQHPLPPAKLSAISHLEPGKLRSRVRVVRTIGKSEFCQDYILEQGSAILKIKTTVDWQENQVMVKAAFPLNVEAHFATYEIPCGAIRRPTQPQTPAEKAKWEVPALRWADLTGKTYGVSLLNDCKYGYDSQPNQLRLTLLRSPHWPDPETDRGFHEFTYALYPHAGTWETAHTVKRGYELNIPLQVIVNSFNTQDSSINASPGVSFLNLTAENLILMALKPAEDNPQQLILRCYECHGETAELSLQSNLEMSLGDTVDLLERSSSQPQSLTIQPWKIASFQIVLNKPV
ncbi:MULTISPECIES: alpha-mannosidase [unclassified Anabaena]|uniref:alpha-mannosidase n=1 Tax=unclassified Anabaena TaxID=2619674 RepID=UPI0039C60126